jgi:predicted adenine nucleotide alpha hydrolase (AANH) superfamily ATPase
MPIRLLRKNKREVSVFYYNPNIQPEAEYQRRRAVAQDYFAQIGVSLVDVGLAYNSEKWQTQVGCFGGPYPLIESASDYRQNHRQRMKRCEACYHLRLYELARVAAERGFSTITSTLLVSPYQFNGRIQEVLCQSAQAYGVQAYPKDWREHYQAATQTAREMSMYRQNYCGCAYSREEADMERAARKEQRHNVRRSYLSIDNTSALLAAHKESKILKEEPTTTVAPKASAIPRGRALVKEKHRLGKDLTC